MFAAYTRPSLSYAEGVVMVRTFLLVIWGWSEVVREWCWRLMLERSRRLVGIPKATTCLGKFREEGATRSSYYPIRN